MPSMKRAKILPPPLTKRLSKDQVGIFNLLQKVREIAWVMRKVGIHLECGIISTLNGIFKPCNVGGAKTEFTGAVQYVDLRILCMNLVGELAGTIRRVIVNNQNIGSGRKRKYLLKQRAQIIKFVIRRN